MIGEDNKIDIIGEKDNEIFLAITDHWSWDGSDGVSEETHIYKLQDKLNSYLSYIESGEIAERYNIENKKIIIEIYNKFPLNKLGREFIEKASEIVEKAGFELRINNSLTE